MTAPTVIYRKKRLLPTLIMLMALACMSLSAIGEAFSHGVADLMDTVVLEQDDHPHSHDGHSHGTSEVSELFPQHDPGNHTHESVDQLKTPPLPEDITAIQQPVPFAGGLPRSFRYRLDRPPKTRLTV